MGCGRVPIRNFCATLLLLVLQLLSLHPKARAQASVLGQWQTLANTMPINPIHIALMHNGKVLVVSGDGYNYSPQVTTFQAAVFDPASGTTTTQTVNWDMFCNGMVILQDGRPFVVGGVITQNPVHGTSKASLFDPQTNLFTDVQSMAHGRWYPTVTTLPDGSVMAFSGFDETGNNTNSTVEIYNSGSGWSQQYPPPPNFSPSLYPRMHLLPNGTVFYSAPDPNSNIFNPTTKTWQINVAATNCQPNATPPCSRVYGSSVLLPLSPANNYRPKVMILGGGGYNMDDQATATTEIIDLSASTPAWVYGPQMSQGREEMNATILPNGKVFVYGGSASNENPDSVSTAQIYDPNAGTVGSFTAAASNQYARLYHSTGLLLPDARVLLMGGQAHGLTADGVYEPHIEIYSPPYLFNADGSSATRPTIAGVAQGAIVYGATFQLQTPDAANIRSVAFIRAGADTHAFDMEQRMVNLSFTAGSGVLNITAPPNGSIAPPGYYLLFLINSSGVPSVGQFIQILAPGPPLPAATNTPIFQKTAGDFYFIDSNGHAHELFYSDPTSGGDGNWHAPDWTAMSGAPAYVGGVPLTGWGVAGDTTILGISAGQHIVALHFTTSVQVTDVTNATGGMADDSATPIFQMSTGDFYPIDSNGHVHEMWRGSDGAWHNPDWTVMSGAPPFIAGLPTTGYGQAGDAWILGIGSAQHIIGIHYISGSPWQVVDITNSSGVTNAAGTPIYEMSSNKFFPIDNNGHVHEMFFSTDGTWHVPDWTAMSGAPSFVVGIPATGWGQPGNTYAIGVTPSQHIVAIHYMTSGWQVTDITATAVGGVNAAAGTPIFMNTPGDFYFIDSSGHAHELFYSDPGAGGDGLWHAPDWTAMSGAPPYVAGVPLTGYGTTGNFTILGISSGNHIVAIHLSSSGWQVTDLSVAYH